MAGAPKGNQNAAKTKVWSEAIRKAIVQDRTALDRLAKSLIAAAEQGDMAAIKEIGDRLDGKSVQATEISGAGGRNLVIELVQFSAAQASDTDK